VREELDHLEGYVLAIPHQKMSVTYSGGDILLESQLYQTTYEGLTDWSTLSDVEDYDIGTLWEWLWNSHFDPFHIPTVGLADGIDMTNLYQGIRLEYPPDTPGTTDIWADCLAIIPIDEGYVEIGNNTKDFLILDCQSGLSTVLVSQDGTKETAVSLGAGSVSGPMGFKVSPKDGTNMGLLQIHSDPSGNQVGQWIADVSLRYKPKYILVV
jgi:hypothetical protein